MAITWLASAVLLACMGTGAPTFPVPNRTTPDLQRLIHATEEKAVNSSAAAVPGLLAFLDRPDFRQELGKYSPKLANWTSQELLRAFRAEVPVMELVHNWEAKPNGSYINLDTAEALEFFPNVWELGALGFSVHTSHFIDMAEQRIYGMPPFKNFTQPTFAEAGERPIYIALNMYKVDMGNPGFGDICTVFSGSFASGMIMISAFDTGLIEAHCDPEVRCDEIMGPKMCEELNKTISCRAWPGVLGTRQHSDHLLLSQLQNYLKEPVAMGARLFARALEGSVPVTMAEQDLYWEANIFGGARYPEAVKFQIASFPELFGKRDGDRLRAWCVKHQWPLIWSTSHKPGEGAPRSFDERVLDPEVLLHTSYGHNLTATAQFQEALSSFRHAWQAGAKWGPFLRAQPPLLRLRPLRAADCREPDACVGISLEGNCVCREPAPVFVYV